LAHTDFGSRYGVAVIPTGIPVLITSVTLQFPTLCEREWERRSFGMWYVQTLNRITIGSLGRRSDRPVIGGDLVDALVPAGWGQSILMYSQSTSRSTQPQPGERPVTARSGDVSSTRQHSHHGARHWRERERESRPYVQFQTMNWNPSLFDTYDIIFLISETKLAPGPVAVRA